MSTDFTLLLIRLAYLVVLWTFVLSVVSVIRSDMFGARVETSRAGRREAKAQQKAQQKANAKAAKQAGSTKRPRGAPSHVYIVDGPNAGDTISLDLAPLLIGRGTDAQIRLDDDYVSTRHARIANSGDQWYVEDLGSTNGTYIENHRITQPTALTPGQRIRIGKTTMELRK
ncbi:MAG: FHA domain-containing protein [Nocardioidaceae bacterium]